MGTAFPNEKGDLNGRLGADRRLNAAPLFRQFSAMPDAIFTRALAAIALAGLPNPGLSHALPLGDGMIVSHPERGRIMSCQTRFDPNAPGATGTGSWISGNKWYPERKPTVEGEVKWPNAEITIAREGDLRVVRANNLPLHPSGVFPVRPGSTAYKFDRNPNIIEKQAILLRLPADPLLAQPACVPMGMIGFAISGVAIYNALDAGGRDAPAHEIQDRCNGHPERSSQYHYHDWSPCLKAAHADAPVGWMLDGLPILGPVDAKGHRFKNADLDACHGRTGPVVIDGKSTVRYHYRFTAEFPYTIGCFRAKPIAVGWLGWLFRR
jgi:hypothetical protein